MKRFKGKRGLIFFVLCVVIILGNYYYLANVRMPKSKDKELQVTAEQTALLRDLERNYPPSPKEVVKYYNEISKCFYDGKATEEQLKALASKARELYDEDLKADKTDEIYWQDLKSDISEFEEKDITISSAYVASSVDVEYFSQDGYQCARLTSSYKLRQGSAIIPSEQVFILRKDDEGHWKIFGWDVVEEANNVQ